MGTTAIALLVGLVASTAPVDGTFSTRPKRKFLTVAEILKRMEASPVGYKLESLEALKGVPVEKIPDMLWPLKVRPVDMPKVGRDSSGKLRVTEYPFDPKIELALGEAEEAYTAKDYTTAAKSYDAALKIDPKFYLGWAGLGDCALFSGEPVEAIRSYSKAIALNPDDYRLFFYRGNAHRHAGHEKEMLEDWVTSLTLKPRNPVLIELARRDGGKTKIAVQEDLFVPRGFVRWEGKKVGVYFDAENGHWMGWANCKAFWLAEPSHRREMLGDDLRGWSTIEELECLGSLVSAYRGLSETGKVERDPKMERLEQVIKEGLAGGFVLYELASRIDPQITLKLDSTGRDLVRRYVQKFVLTEAP